MLMQSNVAAMAAQNGQGSGDHVKAVSLYQYCQRRGLLFGQYAVEQDLDIVDYFRSYGAVDDRAFGFVFAAGATSAVFRRDLCGGAADVASALAYFSGRFDVPCGWYPQHVHALQEIQRLFPLFKWTVDQKARCIRPENYPRDPARPERSPKLLDLLTGVVRLDPARACTIPKKKRKHKDSYSQRRRRRSRSYVVCYD